MKKTKLLSLILVFAVLSTLLLSCEKTETKAMEYKDKYITVNMYSYWQSQIKSNYVSSEEDTEEYWSTKISDDETYGDRMTSIVNMNVQYNLICLYLFDEYGLTLSEDETSSIDEKLNDLTESYGSKSQLNQALANYNVNYDILREIYTIEAKASAVYDYLYGDNGTRTPSEDELLKYYTQNYMHCDVIIVFTAFEYEKDEDGKLVLSEDGESYATTELTAEQKTEKNNKVKKIKELLDSGEDFSTVKAEYNEDLNAEKYDKGYYLSANEVSSYGSDMIISLQQMKEGEYDVIAGDNATYIIKKESLGDFVPYEDETYSAMVPNVSGYCCSNDFADFVDGFTPDITMFEESIANYPIAKAALFGS